MVSRSFFFSMVLLAALLPLLIYGQCPEQGLRPAASTGGQTKRRVLPEPLADQVAFILRCQPRAFADEKEQLPSPFTETQELKMAGMALIRFYQLFISSQQNNQSVCIFTPTCSRFGLQAIKKYGLIQGILMTSDRLQRCYGFAGKYYRRPARSAKYPDPIERYAWESYRK